MKALKKLVQNHESSVEVVSPVSDEELNEREIDYKVLTNKEFAKKYRYHAYTSVNLTFNANNFIINANICADPFCRHFGLPQYKFDHLKSKPSRYKIMGSEGDKRLYCNVIPDGSDGIVSDTQTLLSSNWSFAEEIKRLVDINTVKDIEPDYQFHKDECELNSNPLDHPKEFYKRGKSSSNSQKYQCKTCKKITNILPSQRESFTYNQKRNDILVQVMKLAINHTPVTRSLEILGIGSSTYYNKLEWVYLKCLEFLERHETKSLDKKHFEELWLETDKFHYNLNNLRKKGYGSEERHYERPSFLTYIVATVDRSSNYTFRADLSYDYNVTSKSLIEDVQRYKEDKLNSFAQKNARYRYSYNVNQDDTLEGLQLGDLGIRQQYVDGYHINSTYTAYAQYWLLKHQLNVDKINIVSDSDTSITSSLKKVFAEDIKNGHVNIFTCTVDKDLNKADAYYEYLASYEKINEWKIEHNTKCSMREAATTMLTEMLEQIPIYSVQLKDGKPYPFKTNYPIDHPYPNADEGIRFVDCLTDLSSLTNRELAEILYKVELRAVNTFFNIVRRRSTILERPLVASRNEGRTYIYANSNPKYAQYVLTILRTYLNFCKTIKYKKQKMTPAMILGIADKPYTIQDILYMQ